VEDRNDYRNSLPSDSHKTIGRTEETLQGEDSQEDSQEVEASQAEEDIQEVEDIQEAEEYHLEDHQEAVGVRHHYPCHKHIKGSW